MCWHLLVEYFKTDFMKNTYADIINVRKYHKTYMGKISM